MMERSKVLTLMFLAVIASGCLNQGGDGTVTEGPESVIIESLTVNPSQIYADQSVRASMTAVNAGNLPAEVSVGKRGAAVLKDYCPDVFENTERGYASSSSLTTENKKKYKLDPGQKVNLRWQLEQKGKVPLYGKECDIKFSVPFNYSVESFRQVQIKSDPEVQGSQNLQSKSSKGPLTLVIDTLPGTTGKPSTYIAPDEENRYMELMVELVNKRPEEDEYRKGLVDVDEDSLYIKASDPLELDEEFGSISPPESISQGNCGGCDSGEVCRFESGLGYYCQETMDSGSIENDRKNLNWVSNQGDVKCDVPSSEIVLTRGRSVTIQCQVPIPEDVSAPSVLSDITAGVNYTYVKDVGSRTVRVEPRG